MRDDEVIILSDGEGKQIRPLAPKDNLSEKDYLFKVYNKFLTQAFHNPKIHNIALSGSLGSGKSSILRSFDRSRNQERKHFLYVSLADFSKSKSNKKRLELSLLSQLLSCCTQDDLPEGTIGGVPEKFRWLRFCAAWLATMSFAVFVLFFHEQFGALAERFGVPEDCRALVYLLLYFGVGVSLWFGVYKVLRQCLVHLRLSKLILKATCAETEVVLGAKQTSLDRNKFELAYAMSRISSKIDHTVVFEDFERLEKQTAVEIMEKLRELNILTNNYICATESKRKLHRMKLYMKDRIQTWARGWKRYEAYEEDPQSVGRVKRWMFDKIFVSTHIRFVYAISEKTIGVEHRVKFYDCIIPVVPASNPLNGKDKLKKILSNLGIQQDGQYTARLVDVLSPVMVDYRTLLTLQNEYRVLWEMYASRAEKKDSSEMLDKATMLAVVAYKVFFPRVFEDVLSINGSGVLKRFTETDTDLVDAYPGDESYRKKIVHAVDALFDIGLLDEIECLRMVIGEDQLLDHWLRVLSVALQNLGDPASQEIVKSLTEPLKVAFGNREEDKRQTCAAFKREYAFILNQLLDKPQQFSVAASCFAVISGDDINDWKWLISDVPDSHDSIDAESHKRHFTMCFRFLAEYHTTYATLVDTFSEQLIDWCLSTLVLMEKDDMVEHLEWDARMVELLADCVGRDVRINGAYSHLKGLFVTKDRVFLRQFLFE